MTATTTTPNNGVALEHMVEVREHINENPALANFQWRARNSWVNGAQSRTTFEDYSGAGGEQSHRKAYTYTADHPELFQASDEGVSPPEFVLHALAACITAGIASVAAARGIQLTEVTSTIEGDMDIQGILGLAPDVRNGYNEIRVSFDVKGDASDEELAKVVERATQRSAVFDVITNPTKVTVSVDG